MSRGKVGVYEDLLKAARAYHSEPPEGEAGYMRYLASVREKESELGQLALDFLVRWGGASTARVFPKRARGLLQKSLNAWFDHHSSMIRSLGRYAIQSVDLSEIVPHVCDLFESLRQVRQPRVGGRNRTFGSTAAGKTLHLLLPDLCPIWDQRWIRDPLSLDDQAWSYVTYIRVAKALVIRVVGDVSNKSQLAPDLAINRLVQRHEADVVRLQRKEPVTKILDEAVYDPSFRSQWVKPLLSNIDDLPWNN